MTQKTEAGGDRRVTASIGVSVLAGIGLLFISVFFKDPADEAARNAASVEQLRAAVSDLRGEFGLLSERTSIAERAIQSEIEARTQDRWTRRDAQAEIRRQEEITKRIEVEIEWLKDDYERLDRVHQAP